jgi:xylan 1,4-beta-xylosidase
VVHDGVRVQPDINAIAGCKENGIEALIWNYHDDDVGSPAADVDLEVDGLPAGTTRVLLEHFRVDSTHSNAFAVWKEMGSPQSPSDTQFDELQNEGQLHLLTSPEWMNIQMGSLHLQFSLPRQSMSLVRLTW